MHVKAWPADCVFTLLLLWMTTYMNIHLFFTCDLQMHTLSCKKAGRNVNAYVLHEAFQETGKVCQRSCKITWSYLYSPQVRICKCRVTLRVSVKHKAPGLLEHEAFTIISFTQTCMWPAVTLRLQKCACDNRICWRKTLEWPLTLHWCYT